MPAWDGSSVTGLPSSGMDAVIASNSFLAKAGGTMTGPLLFPVSDSIIIGGASNIMIGLGATSTVGSVAIGQNATGANSDSVAVGKSANGNQRAAAVGASANANDDGVAIGYAANGTTTGAAIGRQAVGFNRGIGIGSYTVSRNYSTAVGYNSAASNRSISVGDSSDSGNTNIAIGAYSWAKGGFSRIAIGASVSNVIDSSAVIRGNLYLDGATGIYTRATFGTGDWSWSYVPTYICTGSVDVTTVVPVSVPCHLINITSQRQWTCYGSTNDWK